MDYTVRPIDRSEYHVLEDFLYEAIYIPAGMSRPARDILTAPELRVYLDNFGERKDDFGFVAIAEDKIIGAVWARIMNDYGHIDDDTPSLALAVRDGYRRHGVGTALLRTILNKLQESGYRCVSLSVQKSNPAQNLYKKLGFEMIGSIKGETAEDMIMRRVLAGEVSTGR